MHFFLHHINAYEIEDGQEIILDLSPSDPYALRDYLSLENMLNPPEFSNGTTPMAGAEVTRYHIYLDTGSVEATTFPNLLNGSRYINAFDFPTINEAYRGKEVCLKSILQFWALIITNYSYFPCFLYLGEQHFKGTAILHNYLCAYII